MIRTIPNQNRMSQTDRADKMIIYKNATPTKYIIIIHNKEPGQNETDKNILVEGKDKYKCKGNPMCA